jgi:ubiquinone/menaquinone biosynthesis C-methylase UbiE
MQKSDPLQERAALAPPRPATGIEEHYDQVAEEYVGKLGADAINRDHLRSCRNAFMAVLGSGFGRTSALEMGAGTGLFTETMANLFDRLIAVDISQGMLDILTRRLKEADVHNVTIIKGDVMHLDAVPSASVDVAYFIGLLEHIADPVGFFKEASRIVRPGGRIVGSVSNALCPYYALRRRMGSSKGLFDGVLLYRREQIESCARAAGLKAQAFRYWGSVPAQFPDGAVSATVAFAEKVAAMTPLGALLGGIAFRCDRPSGGLAPGRMPTEAPQPNPSR